MSNLRQRPTADRASSKGPPAKAPAQPASSTSLFSGIKLLVGAVVIVSGIAFFPKRDGGDLPTSYALCSRTGKGVYTVDAKNSQQQCLVVHEERIVDTGDLGEFCVGPYRVLLMPSIDDVQKRWNVKAGSTKLPVRYIDSGSIVVPGMSGP
jgi:outer membrane protein assembly factor BamB